MSDQVPITSCVHIWTLSDSSTSLLGLITNRSTVPQKKLEYLAQGSRSEYAITYALTKARDR